MGWVGRDRGGRQMLLDLAQHLKAISLPPRCPPGWGVQTALAVADGAPIGGDFIVFDPPAGGGRLQAVVVDASGKGAEAATRSVMLAGAISGLLGEVPPDAVLPAINRHIMRLAWDEHFATAVHVDIDLRTGGFDLGVAGHPAPAHYDAGSGRWRLLRATGPALGFFDDATWTRHTGRLGNGDALLIVTDGIVEVPGQDLELGLDRLLGHAEHLVLTGFQGGAQHLLARRRNIGRDDAQVLLITCQTSPLHRTPLTAPPHQRSSQAMVSPYPRSPKPTAVEHSRPAE